MKYKSGDKVKVAYKKKIEENPLTNNSMGEYADKIVTIEGVEDRYDKTYFIKEDENRFCWPEELLSFCAFYDESIEEQENLSLEDKIKTLEADVEKIDKKISRYREIARQKLGINKILSDIEAERSVEINDVSTSSLNFPDCSSFIRAAIAKILIETSNELDRLEKEI